jgi:hypothetical protein
MGQAIVVGLIVLMAALYAAWALMPAALRVRLAQRFAAVVRRGGQPGWLIRAAVAIERNARRGLSGCGDCGAVPPKRLNKD